MLDGRWRVWVAQHSAALKKLQGFAETALQFMPGRFGASELYTELVYSVLGLNTLLIDHVRAGPLSVPMLELVRLLRNFQLVTEVVAQRFGSRITLAAIVAIEVAKFLLRAAHIVRTQTTVLVEAQEDEGAADGAESPLHALFGAPIGGRVAPAPGGATASASLSIWEEARRSALQTRSAAAAAAAAAAVQATVLSPAQSAEAQRTHVAAECLFVARPAVYALALALWGRRWRSWLLSLLVDVASLVLHARAAATLSTADQEHVRARIGKLLMYVVRPPVLDRVAPWLLGVVQKAGALKMVGPLMGHVEGFVSLIQSRYFYTNDA